MEYDYQAHDSGLPPKHFSGVVLNDDTNICDPPKELRKEERGYIITDAIIPQR